MTTSLFANTSIPHNYLTEELAVKYANCLRLAKAKSTNPHGGEYIGVSLDDDVNKDRPFKFSWKFVSTFGLSQDKSDKKDEKEEKPSPPGTEEKKKVKSFSITAPLRKNPHLAPVVDALDTVVVSQYAMNSAAYNDSGEPSSKEVAKSLMVSCARPPKKKESLAKYGPNFKFKCYAEVPLYIRDSEGKDTPAKMAEVEKKPGTFIVSGSISKLHINGKFNLVFLAEFIVCEFKPSTDACFDGILNLVKESTSLTSTTTGGGGGVNATVPSTSTLLSTPADKNEEPGKRKFIQVVNEELLE